MKNAPVLRSGPLRYATARRFGLPRPVTARERTPPRALACPQLPSRLDAVMGKPRDRIAQGEDCLQLTVTAPGTGGRGRPVVVWFHGGGFSSGSGLRAWYDAGDLAAEGGVVVVSVNYRLGALGYLVLDGVSEGNLGLHDQVAALRWVQDHIAAYGGDPENVTVVGQSAGALSAVLLMRMPTARGLFHRAVLQSAPLDIAARPVRDAAETGRSFAEHLRRLCAADPRTAPAAALLAVQARTAADHRQHTGSALEPPFTPVTGVPALPGTGLDPGVRGTDVFYGWNADDMSAFPPGRGEPADIGERTGLRYREPLARLAAELRRAGARTHAYRLDWRPPGTQLGATHCVELPLLLGPERAWRHAPMLGSTPWREVTALGRAVRGAWISFIRTGTPGPLPRPLTDPYA
ncbi:carboxylesterase family protein [Streptomyces coffeae]|uniref:Carboxylesterase/lipase family protein n=1 Tax=Streptomyces coffeae TaxID=621382 RepID=A0ABS1NEK6_9ACTN|nr:carboxylesterase family protein [Streptomyces coffeae]MBL1098468.1 carboxylesterase/lipase family protein [Streptomyces coffeae]